eukprot:CAMPEP_0113657704 /NCGR_PEP_ID=MMETSP0017_2-20120614/31226_1 /TAXON_ID=2856 /ORGANISM="Cylindrotheca closterium" /LENGTH=35 /DNA_ID=CAMNT_0000571725 /DNA_START=49 /DNA_END=156 /DNA_ORIENTATION=+ /assembly_acc=CAM_ASM_000147
MADLATIATVFADRGTSPDPELFPNVLYILQRINM